MNRLKPDRKRLNYPALAFAIPFFALLGVMIISGYTPFGHYSMLYSDMYHQYYPFFAAFHRTLRSGGSLLYSWDVGMGIDYLSLISYYLASPLNLLSILVPDSWLLGYFSLLVPVKLGLAGLFFAIFLRELFDRDDFSVSVFGGCYGLCAWALGFQWNIMWVDTFALLPLVALGTVRLLRDKRFLLYTLTLFLAVYANYYIGLFVCFFVFLSFFCYEFCRFAGWKRFFQDLWRIGLFSVLAIGMTLFLTLPTVAALQTTQSSVNTFPKGFRLNIASKHTFLGLLDAMRQVAGNMGGGLEPNFKEGLPNLYCGVGSILFGVLFLFARGIKWRDKVCCVFLLLFFNVSFIIRQLDYIWHGFHFTNMIPYRFSFLYSFVLLYMAYRGFMKRAQFHSLQILSAALFTGAILCCSNDLTSTVAVPLGENQYDVYVYILYNFGFLILYTIMLLYGCKKVRIADAEDPEQRRYAHRMACIFRKRSRGLWLGVACAELIATTVAFGLYFPGTFVANYPKGTEDAQSIFRYIQQREKWNRFYRTEVTHTQTLNDGALNDYHGISAFTSSANVHITYFLKALGYGAKNTYNRYAFEESSPVANLFLNLKYMVDRDGHDRSNSYFSTVYTLNDITLLENAAYLPMGFLAEPELADVDFLGNNDPFVFQNQLFTAASGADDSVLYLLGTDEQYIWGENLTVTDKGGGLCAYSDVESGGAVVYNFTAPRDGVALIHLDLPKRNEFVVWINNKEQYRENISLPQMLSVGNVENGDLIQVRISCKAGENGTGTVKAAIVKDEVFREGYARLHASTWELTEFKDTAMEGTIVCNRDGLLYTSIPQNGNWIAFVDGERTEITLVGDCMAAVPLSEGSHTVRFEYHNRTFSISWKISAGCALILLLLALNDRYGWLPRKRESILPTEETELQANPQTE